MDFKWLLMGAAIGAVLAFFRRGGSVTRGG
jgi:hypothetical protein